MHDHWPCSGVPRRCVKRGASSMKTSWRPSGGGACVLRTWLLGRAICSRRVLPGVMEVERRGVPFCVDDADLMLLQHSMLCELSFQSTA